MKSQILQLAAHVLVLSAMSASAAVRYVNVNSASPTPPYTNWTTAAKTIQDAVDAAVAGDQILVTNGVYQTGARAVDGTTNRVAVSKALTLQSVNGAAATLIQGEQGTRCVYLTNGTALVGFTLTNGTAHDGGGVWCESASAVVSNCVLTGNSTYGDGGRNGGGASGGTLFDCTLSGNSATNGGGAGGGAFLSTLFECTLSGNSANTGGGAWACTLNNCLVNGNSARVSGGGATGGTLNNCTLTANSAAIGGGAIGATLNNCVLTGNSASYLGGGGAAGSTLNNCTLTANSASAGCGGGAAGSTLNNCIVYYNSARSGDNGSGSLFSYSCTTPLPPDGVGNISAEPLLADLSHLSAGSPCRGAGSAAYATGLDFDGETWANPPSIGCDEYHSGAVTGPLSVAIQANYTSVAPGFAVNFRAQTSGHAIASRWEFGDGTVVSNRPYASHSWAVAGDYPVIFQAYNDTYPGGISATVTVHVVAQPVHYVALGSAHPLAPYTSWATAATSIQAAVDAASVAGALVLVTNGVYQTGEQVVSWTTNRVAVTKAILLRSLNGAAVTVIQGYRDPDSTFGNPGVRCVYLANGATLVGFTLTNGVAEYGGGVWCESASAVVSNCVFRGNSAPHGGGASSGTLNNCSLTRNSAYYGGGAVGGTLNNCILTGNTAVHGGGAYTSTLNNCTLSGNSSDSVDGTGGGVADCTLNNCIIYNNSAADGDNYSGSFLSYSCTTPLPTNGLANFTNAPLFVNQAGGNLRLQSNSPCLNAGANDYAPSGPDLDGRPRIVDGTVDLGAYEFQLGVSGLFLGWLEQYGLPTDGSADYSDSDGDFMNNWQEWRTGTNPTNALSVLRLLSPASGAPGVLVSWQSVSGRKYFLERGTRLGAQPPFLPLATGIVGQPGTTTFRDINALGAGPFFYRVGVQE